MFKKEVLDGYDTLTFEPRYGGQYEIAVRIGVLESNKITYRVTK